ncbi:phage major capsid protein [Companilactobacillus futsaii]|uniref:phage major capsid protein n=1 Tax=Companilactobacillus futsaii TaxID=938155 RepID=UPI00189DFA71|nr:phage major capsid protein [Companilactobacillus futsaii]
MNNDEKEKRLNTDANLSAQPTKEDTGNSTDSNANKDDTTKDDQQNGKSLSGYAITFGQPSKDLGGFTEVIDKNAFDGVDLSDVYMVSNHDFSKVLASTKAGTLKLNVDDKGLHFEAQLPDTTTANDTYENVKDGNLSSMSFSFAVADDGDTFTKDDDGNVIRTIKQVKSLFDVSVVAIPAYDDANVQVNKRSYEEFIKSFNKKEVKKDMTEKTILDGKNVETRSFEDYIRSEGEQRDGLTTDSAKVVVPSEVIGDVFDLKQSKYNLAQYATVKNVGTAVGTYPVATNQTATLATKEELAQIADVDAEMFKGVDYKVATRAGKIYLSNELVEDSEVNIVQEVKAQLQKLVDNTDNVNIVNQLKTFAKVSASSVDDLKKVYNVDLDPSLDKSVITNQSGFNWLDTLKDEKGDYLLQPSITAVSGKQLFGADVIVISDKLLPNPKTGVLPMIIGDIAQAVFVARKNQVQVQWDQFDSYSQGLAVIIRNDYEKIDEDSARYIEVTPATAVTPAAAEKTA